MEESKLEQYEKIQALVQKEIKTMFADLYRQEATKYGVASVPLHRHNGSDSPIIGDASITNFQPLPAGDSTPPDGGPGVANPGLLDGQVIYNTETAQLNSPATAFVMPLHIIHGFGMGAESTFHGGNAPLGSAILFVNPDNAVQLFFRVDRDGFTDKWWGVTLTDTES